MPGSSILFEFMFVKYFEDFIKLFKYHFLLRMSAGYGLQQHRLSEILNTVYKVPVFNVEAVTESTGGSDVLTKNIIAIIQKRLGGLTISFSAKKDVDGNVLFPNFIQFFFVKRCPVCAFVIASMGFIFFTLLVQPKQNIRITKTTITTQNICIKSEF